MSLAGPYGRQGDAERALYPALPIDRSSRTVSHPAERLTVQAVPGNERELAIRRFDGYDPPGWESESGLRQLLRFEP